MVTRKPKSKPLLPPNSKSSATSARQARAVRDRPLGAAKKSSELPRVTAVSGTEASARSLTVGDRFPDITLHDQSGRVFGMSSLQGHVKIVYFYPKDDTSGCTREACSFQEHLRAFKRLGTRVVGISPDNAVRHAKFAEKHGLEFTLLADVEREYAKACGALVPKTLYGRTSIGIERSTFLIDAKGVIRRVWRKVRVDGHVEEVLQAVRELGV